ncbi:MAG: DinB family protein [Planctomycetales bacterium]
MDARAAIKGGLDMADMISQQYLGDLSDADLLVRPVPGNNHIAWQLGHLIASEHGMIEETLPGSMPKLPEGFVEKHSKETAGSDKASDFLTKAEYLKLMAEQRAATVKALAATSDSDLDKPGPEKWRNFVPTVGAVFNMQGSHWLMHVGQWAVVRRKLGKPIVI